jgi:hypothetical protein
MLGNHNISKWPLSCSEVANSSMLTLFDTWAMTKVG